MGRPRLSVPAFLPCYAHLAPRGTVRSALRGPVAAVTTPEGVDLVLDEVWTNLLAAVEGQAFRTLIGEFHAFRESRGLPMTISSDAALGRFGQHLEQADNCRRILARYPVLQARLRTVVQNSLDAFTELFGAYAADRDVLRTAGMLPVAGDGALITGIFPTGSDLHNHGRQVIGLRVAGGAGLVFKPRALVSDRFVADLFAAADPYLKFSLRDAVPASVSLGSHGWQEFVAAEAMDSPDQPARYFYRFGALCAVLGAIGASDLHDENVLARGESPCVIDTETMLRADAGVALDSLPHSLLTHLKLSVCSTMLVPLVNPTSPIDVLMAGVGVAGDQESTMARSVIRHGGTDGILVAREPITYRHGGNVARLGSKPVLATQYFPDLLAGYFDGLGFVRGGEISAVLDRYAHMPVRSLLRSTMVYSRFVDASTHPDYLALPEEAGRLLGLLGQFPDFLSPEGAAYVADAERAALAIGDVPHFVTRAGSTDLATARSRLPGVYTTTPLDFARRGAALNAERSDQYHQFLLEECFSEIVKDDDPAGLWAASVFAPTISGGTMAGLWWPRIASTITAVGVVFDAPDGPEIGWLCGIGPDRGASTVTPGNFVSFHDTGGVVAFLGRAAQHADEVRAGYRAADRGLSSLLADYGRAMARTPESVFTGAASLLLSRPDRVDREWIDGLLDGIEERVAAGEVDHDLANGPAGVLMALLAGAGGDGPAPCGAERIGRLCDLVLAHVDAPRTAAWFDVAHGELGLRWVSSRIGRVLGDERLTAETADWLISRSGAAQEIPVPGWCNGAAGLLLTSAEILSGAGRQDWLTGGRLAALVDRATRLPAGRPIDLSVCHGSSGVVQSLIAAARVLRDESLLARARDYQQLVLDTIRVNGFCTGSGGRTSLIGYMLGWAGVGDSDLMLHASESDADNLFIPVALAGPISD